MIATLLVILSITSTPPPEDVVRRFSEVYVRQTEHVGLLQSRGSRVLECYLSKRLRRAIADLRACQKDWHRQQPKGSTDKPPYVDCCLFSGLPDGPPDGFTLGPSETLPDGRVKVFVDFTLKDRDTVLRWRDAYIVARAGNRWVIDDFIGVVDGDRPNHIPLTAAYTNCRGGKWVE